VELQLYIIPKDSAAANRWNFIWRSSVKKHINYSGASGASQTHKFSPWASCIENSGGISDAKTVVQKIQELLNDVRQESKRLAREALSRETLPSMIFCKYCGAKNKASETKCVNCGALMS
jgi:hypothetical protein